MPSQLERWKSSFGSEYTQRNQVDWQARLPAFQEMLGGLTLKSALEVGCNRGHNLRILRQMFPQADICGVEPNPDALRLAQSSATDCRAVCGDAYALPFADASFDLAFTAGVLIHLPPERLPSALQEIHRVSRRYILAVEYFSPADEVVCYRGHEDLLWKRDFDKHYRDQFSNLQLLGKGHFDVSGVWDDVTWWLYEKRTY